MSWATLTSPLLKSGTFSRLMRSSITRTALYNETLYGDAAKKARTWPESMSYHNKN